MPFDFSASLLNDSRVFLDQLTGLNKVEPVLNDIPVALPAVLMEQTANVQEITNAADECIGYEVFYMTNDTTTLPAVSATAVAGTCVIGTGNTLSSNKAEYDPNISVVQTFSMSSKDCDNEFEFMDKYNKLLISEMSKAAQALNRTILGKIDAAATTITDTVGIPGATLDAGVLYSNDASFWNDADAFGYFDLLASQHGLSNDYFILTGQNMKVAVANANFRVNNDNERHLAQFGTKNVYFDLKHLDDLAGEKALYLVDKHVFLNSFRAVYPSTPETVATTNTTYERYSEQLRYFDNYQNDNNSIKSLMYNTGNGMSPVMVDMRHELVCDTTKTIGGRPTEQHNFEMRIEGLMDFVPTAANNTGILKLVYGTP